MNSSNDMLPGGAENLRETHGAWIVACAMQTHQGTRTRRCALLQEHTHPQTRQRLVALELSPVDGRMKGTLILPFGLALQKGAILRVDDGEPLNLAFRTCLPTGCWVDLDLEESTIGALKEGTTLKVQVVTDDSGQDATFSLPLNGFASACERLEVLVLSP